MKDVRVHIRDAGYEALYLAGGFLGMAVDPSPRNVERIGSWLHETIPRQKAIRRMREEGLIEGVEGKTGAALRLTAAGHSVVSGGRDPGQAWDRKWDGRWRLLLFDIPQRETRSRTQFWRWLRAHHFGRLQGSAWITPDPVPALEECIAGFGLDPKEVMVFTGDLPPEQDPREIATRAWDFQRINTEYRAYVDFVERIHGQLRRKTPNPARLRAILADDRKRWWAAVRRDPLLPRALLPENYHGLAAWKARQKLGHALCKNVKPETSA